jgi:proteasome accessory factor A
MKEIATMWEHAIHSLEHDQDALVKQVDWIAKRNLIESYREKHKLSLAHPRIALMDLAYHDVNRKRGLYYLLERRGLAERMCSEEDIERATQEPPQTTRAKLRGEFIRAAKRKRRDFTVDWVHLKLNDQAQRTVLCKDPFRATDERVAKLIASL